MDTQNEHVTKNIQATIDLGVYLYPKVLPAALLMSQNSALMDCLEDRFKCVAMLV